MTDPAHILVVDDDPTLLKMTVYLLEQAGYRVTTATSGAGALRQVEDDVPDLVLLDVVLPDQDGVDVCRQLKQLPATGRPYVILLSAVRTESEARAFGLESGADGYISRPIANRELLARVAAMLRLKQVETALAQQTEALQEEVAQRREIEQKLRESEVRRIAQERLAAIGQLTAGLAHSFNNILAGIMLRAQIAERQFNLNPDEKETIQIILEQSTEAAALVEKLLDFSMKAYVYHTRLDLAALVEGQVDAFRDSVPAGVDLSVSIKEGARFDVNGNADRLHEALRNLLLNAVEALAEGGRLEVELRAGPAGGAPCVACEQPVKGTWIQLAVADSGSGIDPEILPRIFEPFFTTRAPERRGLGLSQVLGIVKQHGGHVAVSSTLGQGTTLTLYLPPSPTE